MEQSTVPVIMNVFPVTVTNALWISLTLVLIVSYVLTYLLQSENNFGKLTRYLVEYGKSKPMPTKTDLPKRYFTHYYTLASLWNSACFLTILGLCSGVIKNNWIANVFFLRTSSEPKGDQLSLILAMAVLTIQSFRRLHECLFVSVFSPKATINIIQYLWGCIYYVILAPTLISESLPINKLPLGQFEIRHLVGIIGFVVASYLHHQSHVILANLRKKKKVKNDSHGLPEGGLFNLVSCPHYFAELLIYVSTLPIIWSQCASWWLVLLYNVIAHVNMAAGSHSWYKKTFPSYPKNRKALIPFLY